VQSSRRSKRTKAESPRMRTQHDSSKNKVDTTSLDEAFNHALLVDTTSLGTDSNPMFSSPSVVYLCIVTALQRDVDSTIPPSLDLIPRRNMSQDADAKT
jgi:hypothetical protein